MGSTYCYIKGKSVILYLLGTGIIMDYPPLYLNPKIQYLSLKFIINI